jgi:deazaflavin-dependent oxidoreductase (nitroreductase family)
MTLMLNASLVFVNRNRPSRASTSISIKPLNWVPAAILRSPLHPILSSKMLLIKFVGRRSGRRYATPVNYHQDGRTVLITTDSSWFKNFTGGGQAIIHLRGRTRQVRVELVTDQLEATAGLVTIVRAQPGYGRWANVKIASGGVPDYADARAEIARGRVLLRLHLVDQQVR